MSAVPADPAAPVAPPSPPEAAEPKLGFFATLKTFPRSFWMGCGVEMWERMAYYCVRAVLPLYIAQADDPGGLHFSQAQKGTIFAVWALVQSIVPMVSGGLADRYGYKRTIATSVTLACTGYILMANLRSYPGFFFGCLVLALGTAISSRASRERSRSRCRSGTPASAGASSTGWSTSAPALVRSSAPSCAPRAGRSSSTARRRSWR